MSAVSPLISSLSNSPEIRIITFGKNCGICVPKGIACTINEVDCEQFLDCNVNKLSVEFSDGRKMNFNVSIAPEQNNIGCFLRDTKFQVAVKVDTKSACLRTQGSGYLPLANKTEQTLSDEFTSALNKGTVLRSKIWRVSHPALQKGVYAQCPPLANKNKRGLAKACTVAAELICSMPTCISNRLLNSRINSRYQRFN
ncbi:hypothetical protein D5018_15930 [Parashewanella curva]|uniref:Uncharacterized protein n=1 Tax=Parashewanella curva TaxID=2338552 RepID=A0A3L8PTG5_9GAMM|nr:hypothetical protein [Parashewanella curva]RLV58705.1 hypothetical protein D5018_15930 [Parashewanella curva]